MSGIPIVRQIMWLNHLNTRHLYSPVFWFLVLRWLLYSGDLNTGLIQYPNGQNYSSFETVQIIKSVRNGSDTLVQFMKRIGASLVCSPFWLGIKLISCKHWKPQATTGKWKNGTHWCSKSAEEWEIVSVSPGFTYLCLTIMLNCWTRSWKSKTW